MDTNSALLELALRLVPQQYGPHGPSTEPPQLWPGQVPDSLPFQLPIPDSARLIGSHGRGHHYSILVDTDARPKDIIALYRDRMSAAGWTEPVRGYGYGGFMEGDPSARAQVFLCGGPDGPSLSIDAQATPQGTRVTLDVNLDPEQNPCRGQQPPPEESLQIGPYIPPLAAPPGSTLTDYGGGSRQSDSASFAVLTVDLDLEAVASHYSEQLKSFGWRLQDESRDDGCIWSTWRFQDRDRSEAEGLLAVIRAPGKENQSIPCLHARRLSPSESSNEEKSAG